ncbi:MAG: hypothetical protein IJJ25_09855 [Lachnospiraceae bacterium]|nr:hypothetical protein [Lachnospiraceae bacterium]
MSEEKKLTGIDEIEAGFTAEPEVSAVEQVEIDSFIAGASELNADLEAAGISVPEKGSEEVPVSETAIGIEESVFTETPELSPIEKVEADSYIVGASELNADLEAAGISIPEKISEEVPVSETAIGIEKSVFMETPELSPIEKVEADSYIAGTSEVNADLKAAGIEVPAAGEKTPVPVEETAIGLEETGFNAVPDLTPLEQLDVDSYVSSPAEIEDDMKKAGIE